MSGLNHAERKKHTHVQSIQLTTTRNKSKAMENENDRSKE